MPPRAKPARLPDTFEDSQVVRLSDVNIDEVTERGPTPAQIEAALIAQEVQQQGGESPQAYDPELDLLPPPEYTETTGAYISVSRIDPITKEKIYCCRYAPNEYSLERLRSDKGGGHYWVRLYAPNPKMGGRPSMFWQVYPKLEGTPKLDAPPSAISPPTLPAPADNTAVILAGIKEMGTSLATVLAAAMPKQQSRLEMIQEMQAMANLFKPQGESANPLGLLREVLGVVKELQPDNPDNSPAGMLMGAAEKFLPIIQTAIAGAVASKPAPQVQPKPAQLPPVAQGSTVAPPEDQPGIDGGMVVPQNSNEEQGMLALKMGLNFLVGCAAQDEAPELYAEMVVSKAGPEQAALLVNNPEWWKFVQEVAPAAKPHEAWFTELKNEIVTILREDFPDLLTPAENGGTNAPTGT